MVEDPYFKHKALFFSGITCMVIAFCLIGFSIYIIPFLFLHFNYDVPSFIERMKEWFRFYYHFSGISLSIVVLLPFLGSGIILTVLAKIISSYMEKEKLRLAAIHDIELSQSAIDPQTMVNVMKVILLVILVLFIIYFIQDYFAADTIASIDD